MYKNFFSKTLIALAASGAMTYAVAAPDAQADKATQNVAAASSDTTLKLLEEWVIDLQKAFPTMNTFTLEDYKSEGNRSTATIRTQMKDLAGERRYGEPFVFAAETNVVIENGMILSEHGMGAAKIEWTTGLSPDTNEEVLEFFGNAPYLKADGIVTLAGDVHVDLSNPAPFKKDVDGDVILNVPSYTGTFDTYNGRTTGNLSLSIPSIEIVGADEMTKSSGAWLTNFQVDFKDRPIKGGYWEFSGSSSGSLEKFEVRKMGKSLVTFNNISFSETGSIDEKTLYTDTFTMKGEGSFFHEETEQTVKVDKFELDGEIKNLHIDTYIDMMDNVYSGNPNSDKLEAQALELIKYAPEFNINKLTLSFNGKEGSATLKMSFAAMTEDEKNSMPLYLAALQKFKLEATMDIPKDWIAIFFPRDAEQMEMGLKMGAEEGYIVLKGDRIQSNCKYEMGNLTVNGKSIQGLGGGFPF